MPARRFGRWRLLLAALSLVLVGLGTSVLLRSPITQIQSVEVAETATLDSMVVAELAALEGRSLLDPGFDDARQRLMALPQVKSVSFQRQWPRGVLIQIKEREPYAIWNAGGRDYSVDEEGLVLAAGAPASGAPHIIEQVAYRNMAPGERVPADALALASRIVQEAPRSLGQRVERLEYKQDVGITAVFRSGLQVTFGDESSYDYKVAVLSKLLDDLTDRGVTAKKVDLRFGERVTYE